MGGVDTNEEASWGESRCNRVAPRRARPPHGAPGRTFTEVRQPSALWEAGHSRREQILGGTQTFNLLVSGDACSQVLVV